MHSADILRNNKALHSPAGLLSPGEESAAGEPPSLVLLTPVFTKSPSPLLWIQWEQRNSILFSYFIPQQKSRPYTLCDQGPHLGVCISKKTDKIGYLTSMS